MLMLSWLNCSIVVFAALTSGDTQISCKLFEVSKFSQELSISMRQRTFEFGDQKVMLGGVLMAGFLFDKLLKRSRFFFVGDGVL